MTKYKWTVLSLWKATKAVQIPEEAQKTNMKRGSGLASATRIHPKERKNELTRKRNLLAEVGVINSRCLSYCFVECKLIDLHIFTFTSDPLLRSRFDITPLYNKDPG